jgi:hypothetical protein
MSDITVTLQTGESITVGAVTTGIGVEVATSTGIQGYTGSLGDIGFTGSTGNIGFTGSQGIGFTGSVGIGFTGSVGYTGSLGATGYTGSWSSVASSDLDMANNSITNASSITTTGLFTGNTGDNFVIGYRDVPQNFTNTSYTFATSDAGKHILTQNSGAASQILTIANNATVPFQTGAAISIVVQSTGTVALANGTGVTMFLTGNSSAMSTVTLNSYSMATILKIGTDTWFVSGTGAT